MASKRMISVDIVNTDAFFDLSVAAQALYFHLSVRGDDDGFVQSPKTIMKMCGCAQSNLDELIKARLVISFDSGVIVIRHWKTHNSIRQDRHKNTICKSEFAQLEEVNGTYELIHADI